MTTLDILLNPAPQILAATKAILEKAGHKVFSVRDGVEDDDKLAPYITIEVMNIQASGQEFPLSGEKFWSSWSATLVFRASTARGVKGQKHDVMVGSLYVLSARWRAQFSAAVLPYHRILQMKPSGSVPTTEGLLDHTELHFDIEIEVRENAWPETA